MIKKISILLLTLSLFGIPVSALENETNDKPFTNILIQIYNETADVEIIKETADGDVVDCYEEFVSDTYGYYLDNDFDSVFSYIGENKITIIENNSNDYLLDLSEKALQTRGILTCTYRTDILYGSATGTGVAGNTVSLPITYRITIRVNYDVATGLVSGSLRNPSVYISSTDGYADEWNVTNITCTKAKINNDYEVKYSNIRFTVNGFNSILWQTYAASYYGPIIFAPANY